MLRYRIEEKLARASSTCNRRGFQHTPCIIIERIFFSFFFFSFFSRCPYWSASAGAQCRVTREDFKSCGVLRRMWKVLYLTIVNLADAAGQLWKYVG